MPNIPCHNRYNILDADSLVLWIKGSKKLQSTSVLGPPSQENHDHFHNHRVCLLKRKKPKRELVLIMTQMLQKPAKGQQGK